MREMDHRDDTVEEELLGSSIPRSGSQLRLCDGKKMHRYTLQHVNAKKLNAYYKDLYHTLLNMPVYRFLLIFIGSYVVLYMVFACLYMIQSKHCVSNVQKFSHALWFSVHTAATIGYGHQSPDPDCMFVNLVILWEVLAAALLQAALFGLVFARFATPSTRGSTIHFSSVMVLQEHAESQVIACRIANLRHHQVLRPRVTMLMIRKVCLGGNETDYVYTELKIRNSTLGDAIWLGLPSTFVHVIDDDSPLKAYSMNPSAMEKDELEFVILFDGIDEMTSTALQARHSYFPEDIRWNHRFVGILHRGPTGAITVDWEHFHSVVEQELATYYRV
jgi:hypothetical protein